MGFKLCVFTLTLACSLNAFTSECPDLSGTYSLNIQNSDSVMSIETVYGDVGETSYIVTEPTKVSKWIADGRERLSRYDRLENGQRLVAMESFHCEGAQLKRVQESEIINRSEVDTSKSTQVMYYERQGSTLLIYDEPGYPPSRLPKAR